jgi:hypothetical protein
MSSMRASSNPEQWREGPLWIVIFVLMGLCLVVGVSLVTNPNYDDDDEATVASPGVP